MKKEIKCPYCQSKKVITVCYGLPKLSTFEKAEKGEIHIAGCCPQEENWYCTECKKKFKSEVEQ